MLVYPDGTYIFQKRIKNVKTQKEGMSLVSIYVSLPKVTASLDLSGLTKINMQKRHHPSD